MSIKDFGRFQTQTVALIELLQQCEKLALTMSSIFIVGEEGAGRRSLARWIHDHSQTRGRFLSWSSFLNQEFSMQNGDTLLIENINEIESEALTQLRHFILQSQENHLIKFRIVATSTVQPQEWMEQCAIARELAYQICVVTLNMPSLQDRKDDLQDLAKMFARIACLVNGLPEKTISDEVITVLRNRSWPGNVAELNNAIERAVLKSEKNEIRVNDLSFLNYENQTHISAMPLAVAGISLFEMEKKLIFQTLELTRQNKTRAAQILGISIRTLRNKLNSYRGVEVA